MPLSRILKLKYSKATKNQTEKVFSVYSAAVNHMEQQGIHQWDEIYPDLSVITEDIAKYQMHIGMIDEKIAVCFVLSEECDEEYKKRQMAMARIKVLCNSSIMCKSRLPESGNCYKNIGIY